MAKTYDVTWTLGVDNQTAQGLQAAYKSLTTPLDRIQRRWDSFIRASGVNAYVELVQKGFRAMQYVGEQYTEFLAQEDRKLAFANLAESVGTNTEKIVSSLKRASRETLTFNEIIDSASRALFEGLKPEQLEKVMQVAKLTTKVTGHDLRTAFENLSHAVAINSGRLAKGEGVILDVKKGQTLYQAMLEKSVELNAKFGNSVDSYNERFKRANTSIADSAKNIKDSIMNISTPAVVQSLETTASLLEKINKAMQIPKAGQTPESVLNQRPEYYKTKAMGEGSYQKPAWAITRADIEEEMSQYTEEYWDNWEKEMEKAADNYGKAILTELDQTHPIVEPEYINDPKNMEKLVDNQYRAIEAGWQQRESEAKNTIGYRIGENLGDGISLGAKRGLADGLYSIMTNEFSAKGMLNNTLKMGARLLAESFSETFLSTIGMKFNPMKFFTGFLTSAGGGAAGGYFGGSSTSGGGGGGGSGFTLGGPVSYTAKGERKGGITNNFNYYITDDPTLQKRINEGVRKSFRDNNLRQDIKGI